ncbi:uncharacterized protein LOC112126466 [Cimex lectularius]|uniref:Uncharacterized protein n=1 Tax=Cimex lectularius TaxID=79782 RepID=A0A8I6SCY2_CIMLE|nr:uncharacterized protein LOC112126466 [Cimex lectularius]
METPLQLLIVSNDQQSKLPTVNTIEQLTNRPTALSCHTIQKGDAAPVVPSCEKESSENACNKIPSSIENKQIGQESFEKESTIPKLNVPQEEETKVTEECTPEQNNSSTVNFKERLSLSSPRRGSHVRTLEFNTPPKGINTRKANTSPKNSAKNRNVTQRLLRNFRRGGLFNSPSPTKSHEHVQNTESQSQCQVEQTVKPKKPNAWDSDLRVYTENEDIPTSVGLQRKRSANTKGKDKLTCTDKISDKTDKPTPSNTYLCRIEEEGLNESSRCSLDGEDTPSKSNISTLENEKTVVQSEISCVDGDFLNTHSANSDVKSTNEDNACHTPPDCLSPAHHLSLKNNTSLLASCTKSPGSSLESTLIKECARIENLNTNMLENEGLNKVNEKQHTFTTPFKIEQDVKMMSKNELYKFQTPAKTLLTPNSKQTVEMTPISQIRWEINELGKTKLVTPTLPQTPKDEVHLDEEVSPPSDKMTDISKESTVKVTKGKPKTVTKKTQRTKIQKKPSPNSTVVAVELGAKAKLKKCTKNRNIQEKDFDVEKTIKKCLKQAKNIIYGKGKGTPCNLSSETKEDDKSCGMKTRSRKAQTVNKSPTGIHDKSIPENVDEIESAKLPHQLKDPELVPKNVTRQIDIADEESGGSFPHLYLSEDEVTPTDSSQRISNVQVVSESSSVSKKIPSCHQNEKSSPCPSNDKKVTGENHEILLKNKLLVDNKTNNNIIVKNNIRNHIENFKYTFSVIDEDSGEYVSKDLKISPFLDLFELPPTNETRPSKYSDENKNKTKEEEVTKSKSSHQKEHVESNKKQEKRSFNFELSSDIDKRRRVRSSCSSNEEFDTQRRKRQCLSRSSYKEAYSQSARRKDYDRHFKERVPYSRRRDKTPFSSRRPRYSRDVEDSRKHSKSWSDERNDYRRKKSYNSPYKGNSSDWHLKDNFEEDAYNKSKDGRKTKPSEYYSKYPENRRSEKEDLLQLKSKEIQEIINQNKELNRRLQELEGNNKAHKQNESCKEEGELSDTTCSVSPKRKKPYSIFSNKKLSLVHSSSVAEDCRTTLLKELDVDSFLSIVHGSDENKPI